MSTDVKGISLVGDAAADSAPAPQPSEQRWELGVGHGGRSIALCCTYGAEGMRRWRLESAGNRVSDVDRLGGLTDAMVRTMGAIVGPEPAAEVER